MMPIEIRKIENGAQKSDICAHILHSLPRWFGNEEAVLDYIDKVRDTPFCAVYNGAEAVGFVALKEHNAHTAEIMVMGVLPEYHRQGLGRQLVYWCEEYCRATGKKFLTVKTLDGSRASESYEKTRLFYQGMGFIPLEVFPMFWDADNPCLFLVRAVESGGAH